MLKALNLVAKDGVLNNTTAGNGNGTDSCSKFNSDVCTWCDTRDYCSSCDSEWCAPFAADRD